MAAIEKPPSSHRRVRWRKPTGGHRRPGVLDATRAELVRGLEQRHGSLYHRICRLVIIAGYPLERALQRVRKLRADGTESLLAMTVALLYLADIRSGFIGRPGGQGGHWHRYTLADLAQLAFGAQTEAELRRARRALDMMVSLGWAFPTKQVRRYNPDDHSFVGLAGVRRLNLSRLCQMTGTSWLLKRDRMHLDATKGNNVADLQERRAAKGQRHVTGLQADIAQAKRAWAARSRVGQVGDVGWHLGQAPKPPAAAGPLTDADIREILDDEG